MAVVDESPNASSNATTNPESGTQAAEARQADLAVALRSALQLGASLLATWTVAIAVRFVLPRQLGPEGFGHYAWVDNTAALACLGLGFGLDTYIQREVSKRADHAQEFVGGVFFMRGALGLALLAALGLYGWYARQSAEVAIALVLFGLYGIIALCNSSLGALLQASTKVGRLAVSNVLAKVVWGGGTLAVVAQSHDLRLLALPLLGSELLRMVWLVPAAHRAVGLRWKVDPAMTRVVLLASLPFFVNTLSYMAGGRIDVWLLGELTREAPKELGYYGAAQNLASLTLLLAPLESWVVTPLLTRALVRSEDEFFGILRRATEGIAVLVIPATLMVSLGAPLWLRLACGDKYGPGAASLASLAPSFVFTYLAVLFATALILLNRSWEVTRLSLLRLALQPALMLIVIPGAFRRLGEGGAGRGDALVFSVLEAGVALLFAHKLGRRVWDARIFRVLAKSLLATGAAVLLHSALGAQGWGSLAAAMLGYSVVFLSLGGLHLADVRGLIQLVRKR